MCERIDGVLLIFSEKSTFVSLYSQVVPALDKPNLSSRFAVLIQVSGLTFKKFILR